MICFPNRPSFAAGACHPWLTLNCLFAPYPRILPRSFLNTYQLAIPPVPLLLHLSNPNSNLVLHPLRYLSFQFYPMKCQLIHLIHWRPHLPLLPAVFHRLVDKIIPHLACYLLERLSYRRILYHNLCKRYRHKER